MADFIRKTKATKPNGWKQVNDVKEGEIVLLAGQPCEVDDLETWWAGKPGRSDGTMKVTGFSLTEDIEVEQTFNMWTNIPIFIGEPKKCDYVVVRRTSVFTKRGSLIDLVTRSASKAILYYSASSTTPVYPCRWTSLKKQAEGTFGKFSTRENVLVRLPLYRRGRPRKLTKKKLCASKAFWRLGGSSSIMTSPRIQTELNNDNLRLPENSDL